jgi:RNA polymerase-interacting CarD/CdnL/TRCF family regulator
MTAAQAKKVLDHLKEWEVPKDKEWKARADANRAAIDQGDPFEYAKVFKSLSKLGATSDLRPQDRAHLNKAKDFLTEELAFSLEVTPDRARRLISKAIGE